MTNQRIGSIKRIASRFLDLLYPPGLYCNVCGNLIDEKMPYHLCAHCLKHFRWDMRPPFEISGLRYMACVKYGIYERSLIFSLKYRGRKYIARDIADMMADKLQYTGETGDVIVPVPLFPKKEKERGFNQAALIGGYLSKRTGIPMLPDALRRVRETVPMRGLSPEERDANIKESFQLEERRLESLRNKRIILLDDFVTTGATGREAKRALGRAEPEDVLLFSFAARYGERVLESGDQILERGKHKILEREEGKRLERDGGRNR